MTKKPLKSWSTLARESKARRVTKLTPAQIEKLNNLFEEVHKEQEQISNERIAKSLTLDKPYG